jgi:sugar phosphate isomerase/epimerase
MAHTDLDVPAAIRKMGKMIKLVHVADVSSLNPISDSPHTTHSMIPGRGKLDFISIFRALKDVGYNGEIVMDFGPAFQSNNIVSELSEGRKFLEAKWNRA